MPLSDHEKRMLQEMEAALLTEDPRLFSALSGEIKPVRRSRTLVGLGLVFVGVATLFGGLIAKVTPVGVLGFAIALAGVIAILSSLTSKAPGSKGARKGNGLGSRLEQRWDERNNK
jgi:Protein of unknown function (DUF3040)